MAAHRTSQSYRPKVAGKLLRMVGLTLEAIGINVRIGERCMVERPESTAFGSRSRRLRWRAYFSLCPLNRSMAWCPGSQSLAADRSRRRSRRTMLLGRVLDGMGRPLDGLGRW